MGLLRALILSWRRTVMGTLDFSGRARRQDIADFYLALMLAGLLVHGLAGATLAPSMARLVNLPVDYLLCLPFVALSVRRLHDSGRSGWWALLLLPVMAASLNGKLRLMDGRVGTYSIDLGWWMLIPALLLLFLLGLLIAPGTLGTNRYGADPRVPGGEAGKGLGCGSRSSC